VGEHDESGRVLRPDFVVLGDEALVPGPGVVTPPPERFTHELVRDEPYWHGVPDRSGGRGPERNREPDGVLAAGTPVVVVGRAGGRSRVVDATGLLAEVPTASLKEAEPPPPST
jgi:hypothetical protein